MRNHPFLITSATLAAALLCACEDAPTSVRTQPNRALQTPYEMASPLSEATVMDSGATPIVAMHTYDNPNRPPVFETPLDFLKPTPETRPAPTALPPGVPPVILMTPQGAQALPVKIIQQGRPADQLAMSTDPDGTLLVNVTSPGGIGSVVLERVGDTWPAALEIHLQYSEGKPFTTLENFSPAEIVDDQRRLALRATVEPAHGTARISVPAFTRSKQIVIEWIDAYR